MTSLLHQPLLKRRKYLYNWFTVEIADEISFASLLYTEGYERGFDTRTTNSGQNEYFWIFYIEYFDIL